MGERDAAVDEENRETGEREQPGEDVAAVGRQVDEGEAAEEQLDDDDGDGTALLVNIGEDLRSHACRSN